MRMSTDGKTDEAQEASAEAAVEEKPVDSEEEGLKNVITMLESQLKGKRGELSDTKDLAEKYSKSGYIRQVALVENRKRVRGSNMADGKSTARANVVRAFVPILDELENLGSKYEGNSFASSLGALKGGMENAFREVDVTEYVAEVGSKVDGVRVVAGTEEFSEDVAKGVVISVSKAGLEIQGNVVRPSSCVASMGSESAAEKVDEDKVEDSEDKGSEDS